MVYSKVSLNYTFDSVAKTVSVHESDFACFLAVINQTSQQLIYELAAAGMTVTITDNVMVFTLGNQNMADSDKIIIFYESIPVNELLEVNKNILTQLKKINKNLESIID